MQNSSVPIKDSEYIRRDDESELAQLQEMDPSAEVAYLDDEDVRQGLMQDYGIGTR